MTPPRATPTAGSRPARPSRTSRTTGSARSAGPARGTSRSTSPEVVEPPPGEEFNPGEVTEARQAASLIMLRDSPDGPEVLLVQRNPEQRFMGGAWVFPGGAHDAGEESDRAATAVRELEEEAGIELSDGVELVPFSRWI